MSTSFALILFSHGLITRRDCWVLWLVYTQLYRKLANVSETQQSQCRRGPGAPGASPLVTVRGHFTERQCCVTAVFLGAFQCFADVSIFSQVYVACHPQTILGELPLQGDCPWFCWLLTFNSTSHILDIGPFLEMFLKPLSPSVWTVFCWKTILFIVLTLFQSCEQHP